MYTIKRILGEDLLLDYEVIKNELELRMMSEDDFDRSIL